MTTKLNKKLQEVANTINDELMAWIPMSDISKELELRYWKELATNLEIIILPAILEYQEKQILTNK